MPATRQLHEIGIIASENPGLGGLERLLESPILHFPITLEKRTIRAIDIIPALTIPIEYLLCGCLAGFRRIEDSHVRFEICGS